mmetsp:Transcript_103136/g.183259  ORF Transcript_103136/g.183259 Transcript_103136/m.183259 type:complete len:356 (-) Transcript_103136:160-1227(-)|eukprot:CAMPEP_0197655842 /NCGR_PEP_ID=MMETSP1338-20131121/39702_1 /TAXON_ID=43686 ORGANISM="Pelagodinium beii, Strain RCC1491" /NCGR_SAMPLE_ID=MMETSP1338 /ASSEMBLY_ACC=CAM_ASM_000754 /LENGTH=355 /DNA_ID=CAMNT_0043231569 /DNA_START=81 /DNA_END=1148 /DNA_ORIENTATION=+
MPVTKVVPFFILPWLASARIGMSATSLTEASFDPFVGEKSRILIDFYDPSDSDWQEQQKALQEALVSVRRYGSVVEFAKVDVSKETALAARFVPNAVYPQLVWFANGQATQYHRTLRGTKMIADFAMALDRPSLAEIKTVSEAGDYNRAVLAEIPRDGDLYKVVDAVALRHMDQVAFTYMQSDKGTISWMENGLPTIQYTGMPTADDLDKWVKEQLPHRSEEIPDPEFAIEGGVHMVVNKNFEEKVLQKDKDVILLVHAPWCGHCKKLLPEWRKFVRGVSKVSHLLAAQIDGSRNDSPLPGTFDWTSFPTIFYVRAGETSPIMYKGNRSAESLMDFAQQRSSSPFTVDNAALSDL